MAHSLLAPSSSARWSACTASIGYIEANKHKFPKQDWTFADEGSRAHLAGSTLLVEGREAVVNYDNAEMAAHVKAYVEFVNGVKEPGDQVLIERRVRLFYAPEDGGTVDAALINPKRIYIADLKYGVGTGVQARENPQLAIYAESLLRELELVELLPDDLLVTLAVFQPRDRNDPNPVRLWAITRRELREFLHPVEAAVESIRQGRTAFKAGPHCDKSFCPARGLCTAYASQGLTALSDAPVDQVLQQEIVLPEAGSVTREQRQRVLAAKPHLIEWLEHLEAQEVAELMHGADPVAFKLVEGKTNRQWKDESEAARLLLKHLKHEIIYPPKPAEIISPAQAEKALKGVVSKSEFKTGFEPVIIKPEGKPTLVPVTDSRPALRFNPSAGLVALIETADLI